ncbi:MAG TPA: ABC transporter ATP-binding protein [Candidatus Margulisiibacteriota bacterium]|nr:ABC transporter ATP-binding protein [Candidatus Margulisiibacteriota bacterium]
MHLVAHIVRHLRPYRGAFLLAIVQVVLISALELLKPWPLKLVIDYVLPRRPPPWPVLAGLSPPALLGVATAGLIAIYGTLGIASVLNNFTTISIGQAMVNDLRSRLYQHLQRLSLSFHSRAAIGDLIYRVTGDTYAIQTLAMNGLFPVLAALLLLGGMFVVMLRLDWFLTLVALAVCPLLFAAILLLNRRMTALAHAARANESAVYQLVQRGMSAIKVVQAFTKEEEEHTAFVTQSSASLRSNLRLYTLQTAFGAGTNLVLALGTAAVLWLGAQHVWSNRLTIGDMVVFISYLASLYAPINSLIQTYGAVQGAKAGMQRVTEVLEAEQTVPDGQREFRTPPRGHVRFADVSFGYSAERLTLRGITIDAQPGEVIAIVGPTGAGKSTLVSLIPRFYDAAHGQVLIDDTDVRTLKLAALRAQISMVLQPPMVFPLSIRENIAYGRPAASNAAIEGAAQMAQADGFIRRLPQGYDTVIGEQGATLSEGERQRLTIARALLRDAPILILDEPTSSVDTATEAAIMEAIEHVMRGRTTFVIAHRLSTVRRATQIVVLENGAIVEHGTFDELLRQRGFFHQLYARQFAAQADRSDERPVQWLRSR